MTLRELRNEISTMGLTTIRTIELLQSISHAEEHEEYSDNYEKALQKAQASNDLVLGL